MKSNLVSPIEAWLSKLAKSSITDVSDLFGTVADLPDNFGSPLRKRLFYPSRVFWLFLSQIFQGNCACRDIVRKFLAWLAVADGSSASAQTAAYCKARKRLRLSDIITIHRHVVAYCDEITPSRERWYGRTVKVVDGSSVSLPDTEANQDVYPQPAGQKPGCGFPVMKLVALFSLSTGALLSWCYDSLHHHESMLFRRLWPLLQPGDVLLADRGFSSYEIFASMIQRGVDCVMRNHQRRKVGKNCCRRFNAHDCLVVWQRPKKPTDPMARHLWAALPEQMVVREISVTVSRAGFRTRHIVIVTTLTDARTYPTEAFAELYLKRWKVELYLRDLKTSMGMEQLQCKSPDMVEKELWMYGIAYNLIRSLMCRAAICFNTSLSSLSFMGTCATLKQWLPVMTATSTELTPDGPLFQLMLAYIARDKLPDRPGRSEPRAIKRRMKNYQLLTSPRALFLEIPHRHKYKAVTATIA